MGIMDKAKAAFDANQDGEVEAAEVASTVAGAVKVAGAAASSAVAGAAEQVKKNFDIDEDGKVSMEEVQLVAEDARDRAVGAVGGFVNKIKGNK